MIKSRFIKDYINYYFRAKTKYAIHSPFVFEFVTKVLNQKKIRDEQIEDIEKIRRDLLHSSKEINVLDFGTGSISHQIELRKAKDIVKNSSKSRKYANLLYRTIHYYKLKNILELGTSVGISSMYMAAAGGNVITIEGCPETAKLAEDNFAKSRLKNIQMKTGNINKVLPEIIQQQSFDCVFFDGNHTEEATNRYFELCLPSIKNESVFIFDDISWSEGMKKAWGNIKQHNSVRVTIDLFFMGIVFFRKELSKEDFVIRF
ncbi:MAG: class I SAM-dependent methyltransferase [Bacteroidales bacterium]|jgi:predicted O-methyltransferase YrrM